MKKSIISIFQLRISLPLAFACAVAQASQGLVLPAASTDLSERVNAIHNQPDSDSATPLIRFGINPLSLAQSSDPIKRQKLVIYINPPYAESGTGVGKGFKDKVATENKTYLKYKDKLGK